MGIGIAFHFGERNNYAHDGSAIKVIKKYNDVTWSVFCHAFFFIYFVSLIRFCEVNCRLLQEMVNHVYFYYLLPIISMLNISVSKAFIKLLKKSLLKEKSVFNQ